MDKSPPKSFIKAKDGVRDRVSDKTERVRTPQKVVVKDNTKKPQDFKLHTQERAVKRAMFNYSIATKLYVTELQKKVEEKLHKMIEEEEVRLMRKEMIPRAQLMPYFDRPYFPQRSNRPLTIPREPSFLMNKEQWSCNGDSEVYSFQRQALKPIK
ncbi:protein TPX2-like [Cucurbita pepo subsp. pepo]|uniref:protein TPX2-like n=1 Tax=Cucurbita pepo subsp. pepo TaxID=3664 RepID=UPI000C9D7F99|nr:protein TPX2-like [Cucurbita pepo subsp. pepo]